jgi:hypothetical protein
MRYSKHIEVTINKITLGLEEIRLALNIETINVIQYRVLAISSKDHSFIFGAMKCGLLFPVITEEKTRKLILKVILSIKYLIPSIKSLHENLKLLGASAKILKELVAGEKIHTNLRSALKQC